jgi:hypothetical protein
VPDDADLSHPATIAGEACVGWQTRMGDVLRRAAKRSLSECR